MKAYRHKSGHLRLSLEKRDSELLLTLLRFSQVPEGASELQYFERRLRDELEAADIRRDHKDKWDFNK